MAFFSKPSINYETANAQMFCRRKYAPYQHDSVKHLERQRTQEEPIQLRYKLKH